MAGRLTGAGDGAGVRVALSDDPGPAGVWAGRAAVDDGCRCGRVCGCTTAVDEPDGSWAVRVRGQRYYDADGDPRHDWTTTAVHGLWSEEQVVGGRVTGSSARSETNDATGQTLVRRQAVVSWPWDRNPPFETCELVVDGVTWTVTEVTGLPGALRLSVERIDDGP